MNLDLGNLLMLVLIVAIVGAAAVVVLQMRQKSVPDALRLDPKWNTNPEGKLLEEIERIQKQIVAAGVTLSASGNKFIAAASQLPLGSAYVPGTQPTAQGPGLLNDAYIDRDDLMKAIGAANFDKAVYIDNVLVHNGLQPAAYFTSKAGTPGLGLTRTVKGIA